MRYDDESARLAPREIVQGVTVHRLPTSRFGRGALVGRAVDYLSFYLGVAVWLLLRATSADVIVAKTDPPLLSVLARLTSQVRRFKVVNWLQDLYPEIALEVGAFRAHPVWAALAALRNWSLGGHAVNVAIGEDMAARVVHLAPGAQVRVIPNWSDDESLAPIVSGPNPVRTEWNLEGRFVVGYSGNLGRAHDADTVLRAAALLQDRDDIRFVFVGGGRGVDEVVAAIERGGLRNVERQPYQPRDRLRESLAAADVHWLSLRPGLDGLLLPSKFYGIAAVGRPVIVIGSRLGELARLVVAHDCGAVVDVGDAEEVARILRRLADDQQACQRMGRNARRLLEARFTKAQALNTWATLLNDVHKGG